jgi:nucleoside-diphosphate-sugar epimerase
VNSLNTVLIVGCGYVGSRLGQFISQHYRQNNNIQPNIYGVIRSPDKAIALQTLGIQPLVLNLDQLDHHSIQTEWCKHSVLFYFAPPPNEGERDTRLEQFLHNLPAIPQALIQISTTGVYGNTQGEWVNENSPLNPQTARARRRVSAEHISEAWCAQRQVRRVVLRVPAIYGPNRLPLERLHANEPVIQNAKSPIINRIHVDDLVNICFTAATNTHLHGVYNVSDGNAMTMTEYLQLVARVAHLPMPKQISLEEAKQRLSPELMSYMNESRRVDNSRLLREFGAILSNQSLEKGIKNSLFQQTCS